MTLFFTISLSAQSEPEVLKNWIAPEEAEFYFDASIAIVKYSQDSNGMDLMNAFNESINLNTVANSKNDSTLILQKCLDSEALIANNFLRITNSEIFNY